MARDFDMRLDALALPEISLQETIAELEDERTRLYKHDYEMRRINQRLPPGVPPTGLPSPQTLRRDAALQKAQALCRFSIRHEAELRAIAARGRQA